MIIPPALPEVNLAYLSRHFLSPSMAGEAATYEYAGLHSGFAGCALQE